jgi:SnoaL-like domain
MAARAHRGQFALAQGLLDGPTLSRMETLATQLRTAFNARDVDTFRGLLAEDARWGEDPDAPNTCHNRAEIVAHVKRLLNEGVRASIMETTTGPRGVACLLEVEWPDPKYAPRDRYSFYQVYVVTDGLITEIQGHDDQDSALAAISN